MSWIKTLVLGHPMTFSKMWNYSSLGYVRNQFWQQKIKFNAYQVKKWGETERKRMVLYDIKNKSNNANQPNDFSYVISKYYFLFSQMIWTI